MLPYFILHNLATLNTYDTSREEIGIPGIEVLVRNIITIVLILIIGIPGIEVLEIL